MQFAKNVEKYNEQFNKDVDNIDNLTDNHILQLGEPWSILRASGILEWKIELQVWRLKEKANEMYESNHPFDIQNIKDLPRAIQNPIAVFNSTRPNGGKVILIELKQWNDNFVVSLRVLQWRGGIRINSIRSIYPKDHYEWILDWTNSEDNLIKYVDNKKFLEYLSSIEDTTVRSTFSSVASNSRNHREIISQKIEKARENVENFENPEIDTSDVQFMKAYHGSPHSFEKFSTDFIGSWDGRSMFGWGLYFTNKEDIAKNYAYNGYNKWSQNLYEVKIHENKTVEELNLINWDEKLNKENINKVKQIADRIFKTTKSEKRKSDLDYFLNKDLKNETWGRIILDLRWIIWNDKKVSQLLLKNGFDWVIEKHWESETYVIFDDSTIQITNHIQYMKKPNWEIYGAKLSDGTIYLNPEKINANTPIHEFSHLWEQIFPNEWKQGVEIFKRTSKGKENI